jgi:mannose-6-phosphate isomerase-like protein (cupin superfamily)
MTPFQVIDGPSAAHYDEQPLTNVTLFQTQDFSGHLLGFLPGQALPVHVHAHEDEVFDVIAGQGTIYLDGERVRVGPGSVIVVPPGVQHGFTNTGDEPWLVRATIRRRVYAREALRRAIAKRLSWFRRQNG